MAIKQENVFGLAVPSLQTTGTVLPPLPFNAGDPSSTSHKITSILPENWNQVFPYGFALYEADPTGNIFRLAQGALLIPFGGINRISLSLPPTSIRWSIPFATELTATNGGVIEEHNGVVFRPISIEGSTGLMPTRGNPNGGILDNSLVKAAASLIPATTSAITTLVKQITAVGNSIVGSSSSAQGQFSLNGASSILSQSGYVSFWLLSNFLVAYEEAKKKVQYQNLRLVFEVPKDNMGYVVSLGNFEAGKTAQTVYPYSYQIQMTGFDLVDLSNIGGALASYDAPTIPTPSNPGAIKAVLNVLSAGRNAMLAQQNVLLAANADATDILNGFQQAFLSVKGLVSTPTDISDFANSVAANATQLFQGDFATVLANTWTQQQALGNPDAAQALGSSVQTTQSSVPSNQPVTTTPQGETVNPNSAANQASPQSQGLMTALNLALADPTIAQTIPTSSFTAPASLQQAMTQQLSDANNTSANDIRTLNDKLQNASDLLAFTTDSMDPDYQQTFNLIPPTGIVRQLTEDDVILQSSMQESIAGYDSLLATGELYNEREPDPFVLANQYLDPTDQLISPISCYPVVVEQGSSVDKLAQRYLGDANRAEEIILLNGLRAPYIDETGFVVQMSGIGSRTCIVSSLTNLIIGQTVTIKGKGVASQRRTIVNLQDFGTGLYQVTFDGDSSLNLEIPQSTNPNFTARLPGCVGSNDIILMPSQVDLGQIAERPTYLQSQLTNAEKVFKVDIALGPNGDYIKDQNGDWVLAYGYTNALQALSLKVQTGRGELEQAPEFGLPLRIGQRTSDIPASELNNMVYRQVTMDPRFFTAQVAATVTGTVANINVNAIGAQNTGIIPVNFQVGQA